MVLIAFTCTFFFNWTYVQSIGYAKLVFLTSNSEVNSLSSGSWEKPDSANDTVSCCYHCFLLLTQTENLYLTFCHVY